MIHIVNIFNNFNWQYHILIIHVHKSNRISRTPTPLYIPVAYPGILFGGGGGWGSTNSVEDRGQRERGSGDGSPIVRGSEGSCNLLQEISFHIVKLS